jgi:hypothetical protein
MVDIKPPWEGVGYPISPNQSNREILRQAHLDWEIEKFRLSYKIGQRYVDVPYSAVVKMPGEHFFDIAPNIWNPVRNDEAFDSFQDFLTTSGMVIHTAGSFDGGRLVWALAYKPKGKFFQPSLEAETDIKPVVPFVLFTSPHEYGRAIELRSVQINLQTWTTFLSDSSVRIYHAKEFDPVVAQQVMADLEHDYDDYSHKVSVLLKRPIPHANTVKRYLRLVFPTAGKADLSKPGHTALEYIEKFDAKNWWEIFDAVLYVIDHVLGNSVNTRLVAAWYGTNRRRKIVALEKALEISK